MRFDIPEKCLSEIQAVMDVQLNDPSIKTDSYMRGMANGMILIDSIVRGIEPKYIEKPEKPRIYYCRICKTQLNEDLTCNKCMV